jgi:DNA-dependent RNA polymerase auxiliary subunit epsilon
MCVSSEEYKGVKYTILAENSRYVTVQIDDDNKAFDSPKNYIDYILSAEIEYNIEFVTIVSGEVLMFKKLKKDK